MITPGGFTRFRNAKKERKPQPKAGPETDERGVRRKIETQRKPLKYGKSKRPAVIKKTREKL